MEFPTDTRVARSRTTVGPGIKYYYVDFSRSMFVKNRPSPFFDLEQCLKNDLFQLGKYFRLWIVSRVSPLSPPSSEPKLCMQRTSGELSPLLDSLTHPEPTRRPPDIQSALSQLGVLRDSLGFFGRYSV
jgi:hypothetical protein